MGVDLDSDDDRPVGEMTEIVCDKERCPWRVCARKQNITGKWKITKVVGPHNCADHELTVRHPQLTSTLIAKRLMGILKEQSNMKVRTIIRTVEEIYGGYVITYAVNPGMHYEYIPKPNAWKDGRQIFERVFWCFPQSVEAFRHCRPVFSIDGTFLIGKYRGTLLIAISCDANNMLVPLAFALVERENNDSWGWFLRLVRIHVVGLGREVGIISDRHQGILHAVQEHIEGYAPLHHRWCTQHLAENLLRKDGVKDNFDLFQVATRQLEDYYFQRKLEQVRTATNAEGRQWLAGLMRDLDKWTRSRDAGGWRYEFQLVAWFSERHAKAEALIAGERWAEKPKRHLIIANERASTHEVQCFDLGSGTYQVEHRGGTTSDGEIRESRIHVVVLRDFKCTCGRPRQYHFVCSHLVAAARHRNFDIESMIPHEFSVHTLVRTWSPRFMPFRDPREWPSYDGPKYVADPAYHWNKRGTRKRMRHNMTMDQVSGRTRRGRATPFLANPEQNECGKCGRLGHNSRTCRWQISEDGALPPSRPGVRPDPPRSSHSGRAVTCNVTCSVDRKKKRKVSEWAVFHQAYIDDWEDFDENVDENDEPHTNSEYRQYQTWYQGATRHRLRAAWTEDDYADIHSSDDEDTVYDQSTRARRQVEAGPILDRMEEDDDDEQRAEEVGPSQLQEAPLTQPTQVVGTRLRRPRSPYTPGTDALGHKGKGKTRRQ
uniref:SWIM-type domain-containing protein n=1 Tax=Setaria italica TaxID=4555 RepID=K3XS37_SETIT